MRGYVLMLDSQGSPNVPKVFDYFKLQNRGDCVFMEVTGPTLKQLRDASSEIWPPETLGSIGLQLLRTMKRLHDEFQVAHRDANPSNLAVGRAGEGEIISSKAMLIDFDFGATLYADDLRVNDIRQLLVSIRHLYDSSNNFWAVNPSTGVCHPWHTMKKCIPAPRELCEAIVYACTNKEVDYNHVDNLLLAIVTGAGYEYQNKIIWTEAIASEIKGRLPQAHPDIPM